MENPRQINKQTNKWMNEVEPIAFSVRTNHEKTRFADDDEDSRTLNSNSMQL